MLLLNLPLIVWFVRVKASQEGGVQLRGWQIRDRWKRLLADPPPSPPTHSCTWLELSSPGVELNPKNSNYKKSPPPMPIKQKNVDFFHLKI